MLHKRDEHAVDGWDPEDHPRSVHQRSRPTTRSRRIPNALWTRDGERARAPVPAFDAADRRRARRARRARREGHVDVPGPRARAHEPRQGAVPARDDSRSRDQARARSATTRAIAPTLLPYLARAAAEPATASPTASTARASGRSRRRSTRPTGSRAGDNDDADAGRERAVPRGRQPARARVAREPRRGRAAPVDVAHPRRRAPDVRADRPRPGRRRRRGTSSLTLARLHRTALEHLGVRGLPEDVGPPRHPGLGPDRARPDVRRDARVGRAALADDRRRRRRPRERRRGRSRRAAAAPGSTTRRTRSTRRSSRPYSVRAAPRRAGVDADHVGRARRPRAPLRPLDDPHGDRPASPRSAISWRRC